MLMTGCSQPICTSPADTRAIYHDKIPGTKTVTPPEKLITSIINTNNRSLEKKGPQLSPQFDKFLCVDLEKKRDSQMLMKCDF